MFHDHGVVLFVALTGVVVLGIGYIGRSECAFVVIVVSLTWHGSLGGVTCGGVVYVHLSKYVLAQAREGGYEGGWGPECE